LESENQLLVSEINQLRQEVQILEENLDQSLVHEHASIVEDLSSQASFKSERSLHLLNEQKSQFEMEQEHEQLRKRLAEAEMKSARTIHNLNKEISELEALVESKIYREDELEQELERMKDKLARQKKPSKGATDTLDVCHRGNSLVNPTNFASQQLCEICERPGHDIFSCDLLKEEVPRNLKPAENSGDSLDQFCDDCESHGHAAPNCPHSLEVF